VVPLRERSDGFRELPTLDIDLAPRVVRKTPMWMSKSTSPVASLSFAGAPSAAT
jgi:hypothetical protein